MNDKSEFLIPDPSNAALEASSFLYGTNAAFIEQLYAQYLENPESVDPTWREFFAGYGERAASRAIPTSPPPSSEDGELIGALTGQWPASAKGTVSQTDLRAAAQESIRAIQLVRAYRVTGHLAAELDPLKLAPKPAMPQ